jgi:hypothetical protein
MIEHHEDAGLSERRVIWAPWSPAQLVALVIGVFYLILGAVTLAKTGLNGDGFTTTHVSALGFGHTPLLGVIDLAFGLLLVMAGAVPGAGRGTMAFIGTLALGFGVVVLAASGSLYDSLGVNDANGWLYIITGVVTLVAAIAAPIIFGSERRTVAYDSDHVDHVHRDHYHHPAV